MVRIISILKLNTKRNNYCKTRIIQFVFNRNTNISSMHIYTFNMKSSMQICIQQTISLHYKQGK